MTDSTVPSSAGANHTTKRNAVLAAVGIGLAGLGLAAGLAMRPSATQPTAPVPLSAAPAVTTQAAAEPPVTAPVAAPTPTQLPPIARAEVEPSRPAVRHDNERSRDGAQPVPRRTDDDRQFASNDVRPTAPLPTRPVAVCGTCGVVEAVRTVEREGHGSGIGAVAGGVLGGVLGNRFGGGSGRTALTVLGAVGGGLAGNEAEKRTRTATAYDIRVRMDDGTLRTFEQTTPLSPGAKVVVDGQTLRLSSASSSDGFGS